MPTLQHKVLSGGIVGSEPSFEPVTLGLKDSILAVLAELRNRCLYGRLQHCDLVVQDFEPVGQ
jgi:hypothetical protein